MNSLRELNIPTNENYVEKPTNNNFLLLWGCPPGGGFLSDTVVIQGIPWSSLKHLILDTAFNAHVFGSKLTEQESIMLRKLVKAQEDQGNMNQLQSTSILTEMV